MRNNHGPRQGGFSGHEPTLEQLKYRIELSTRLLETHPENKDLLVRRISKTTELIHKMEQEEKDAATSHWIPWSYWPEVGEVEHGRAPYPQVMDLLRQYEAEAKKLLAHTGADHVLYGRKMYDKEGYLAEIRFYLLPMGDERFERDVVPLTNQLVYALHRR